jgi:cell division protein FtsW
MIINWMQRNLKGDPVIWFVVFALSVLSILVVYSATGSLAYQKMQGNTEYYLIKHSILVLSSLFVMWVAHKIDYRYYAKISLFALWISAPLLLFTYKFGLNINEASRWITIPLINQAFQPSDLAKLALIVAVSSMLAKRQQNIEDFKVSVVPILIWVAIIGFLVALTNLSTSILIFLTIFLLLFIGRVPIKYLILLVIFSLMAGSIALYVGQRGTTALSRIEGFIDQTDIPFQAKQAYIAIASGGIIGKGPGQSDQRNFLPQSYSDFIYAIIIEEYGFIGGGFVLFLYLALLYRGMKTMMNSERAYGGLLSAGLSFALVLQAMVNMAVAVGLGPITGLPLPLVSMGGTSQLFTGIALGIILSVSRGEIEEEVPVKSTGGNKLIKKEPSMA